MLIFLFLSPGAIYGCGEYLLTPDFDKTDEHHMHLHKLFLPTLAATQSNYPEQVTSSLERAGFKVLLSRPRSSFPPSAQSRNTPSTVAIAVTIYIIYSYDLSDDNHS